MTSNPVDGPRWNTPAFSHGSRMHARRHPHSSQQRALRDTKERVLLAACPPVRYCATCASFSPFVAASSFLRHSLLLLLLAPPKACALPLLVTGCQCQRCPATQAVYRVPNDPSWAG
jgi:hypothetical protein